MLAPATAPADDNLTLDKAINGIAKNVAGVAKQRNTLEIVINPITDTGDLTHTAGAGITESLISRLIAEGLKPVTRGADLIFSGEYSLGEAETDGVRQGFPVGRITFKVKRRNGMTLIDSEAELPERQPRITSPKDLAIMSGQTIFRPPSAPEVENNKKALAAIDNKPGLFVIKGARIRPTGAPYAVEMLVAPASGQQAPRHAAFRPRELEVRDGMPFLKVQPGEAVAVRIINEADHDVASTVTLDGLSMFAFSDDKANTNENVIIKQRTSGDVLGWFRNLKTSSAFLVADLPKDHPTSQLLKSPAKIGSITVTFAAAWAENVRPPADEDGTRQATELVPGAPIDAPYETAKRQIGGFRAAVTIRYDKM